MPAPLTITANNQTKAYGAALPTLTVTYGGLVNGDTSGTFNQAPNTAPSIVSTATASSHVSGSPYSITASGAVDGNYSISYVPGLFTVTPVVRSPSPPTTRARPMERRCRRSPPATRAL